MYNVDNHRYIMTLLKKKARLCLIQYYYFNSSRKWLLCWYEHIISLQYRFFSKPLNSVQNTNNTNYNVLFLTNTFV